MLHGLLYGLLAASVLAAPVSTPVAAPAGYERAAAVTPARHWALVRSVTVDRTSGGQANRATLSIHLTPHRADTQLWHEVGHIVAYSAPELEADWRRLFWPRGRPTGKLPSPYGSVSADEDFAESYEQMIDQGCLSDPERDAFLRGRVFQPGELPPCRP